MQCLANWKYFGRQSDGQGDLAKGPFENKIHEDNLTKNMGKDKELCRRLRQIIPHRMEAVIKLEAGGQEIGLMNKKIRV